MKKFVAWLLILPALIAFFGNLDTKLGDLNVGDIFGFVVTVIMACIGITILNDSDEESEEKSKDEPEI